MTAKRFPIHLIFVSVYILGALVTLIPWSAASKTSLLGYKALCSFSPISTLVFLALAGLHIYLHSRKPAAKKPEGSTE